MQKFGLTVVLTALIALVPAVTFADDASSPHVSLIESKAGAVVSLKFVVHVNIDSGGQQFNQEFNQQTVGVVVDASGLIMVPSAALEPPPQSPRPGVNLTFKAADIRVIFPGDDMEYPAIVGAKDSKLGLGFALIKDLGDKKPTVVDLTNTAESKIGDTLYGVSRLGQGFDYAPICNTASIIGQVTKPRTMWALARATSFISQPLYTKDGAVAGVCVSQAGVGDDSQSVFLLPLKVATPTVKRAKKEAERALEEIVEAEAEAAEIAAEGDGEGEGGETDSGTAAEGDDDKKDDAGKDDGDDK